MPAIAPDVDECRIGTHSCQSGPSVCRNTPGSYECICLSGYVRNVTNQRVCNGMMYINDVNISYITTATTVNFKRKTKIRVHYIFSLHILFVQM